jgi:hypothetical protein
MDSRRLKKIERILAVQEKLHEIAEWRLARTEQEQSELRATEVAIVGALNQDDALQGLFVDAMAKRLKKLAVEAERLEQRRAEEARILFEEGLRLKRTERMTGRLRREYRESVGKRGFADLIDTLVRNGDASLP